MRKFLLLPLTLIYWLITYSRNLLFELGILKSYPIPGKSISVGNLALGGTGKTPMVQYLISLLKDAHSIQVLSRGYGRKTKGYRQVQETDVPESVGDETFLYQTKFQNSIQVFVGERRKEAVFKMKKINPSSLILLDDAFQHRYVKPGFQLLLTAYDEPFTHDFHFPSGNLREARNGVMRADAIVITKCPSLTTEEIKLFKKPFEVYQKPIFFAQIRYLEFIPIGKIVDDQKKILLVTGIASTSQLKNHFHSSFELHEQRFPDHHAFSSTDIEEIHRKFDTFASTEMVIVTTEKDYVKIKPLLRDEQRKRYPWYVLPIELKFNDEEGFNTMIKDYVRSN